MTSKINQAIKASVTPNSVTAAKSFRDSSEFTDFWDDLLNRANDPRVMDWLQHTDWNNGTPASKSCVARLKHAQALLKAIDEQMIEDC